MSLEARSIVSDLVAGNLRLDNLLSNQERSSRNLRVGGQAPLRPVFRVEAPLGMALFLGSSRRGH